MLLHIFHCSRIQQRIVQNSMPQLDILQPEIKKKNKIVSLIILVHVLASSFTMFFVPDQVGNSLFVQIVSKRGNWRELSADVRCQGRVDPHGTFAVRRYVTKVPVFVRDAVVQTVCRTCFCSVRDSSVYRKYVLQCYVIIC